MQFMDTNTAQSKFLLRPRLYDLLEQGIRGKITFLSADTGWGKTIAVRLWSKRLETPYEWVDAEDEEPEAVLNKLYNLNTKLAERRVMIIDNFQILRGTETFPGVIEFIKRSPKTWSFVLLSQCGIPEELKSYLDIYQLELISKEMLRFNEEETNEYFTQNGIPLDTFTLLKIRKVAHGWPIALNTILYALKQSGGVFNPEVTAKAREELFFHFDRTMFERWTPKVRYLLMKLSVLENFHGELAMVATGQADCLHILDSLCEQGGYIVHIPPASYRMSPFLVEYLERRRAKHLSQDEHSTICESAGLWYETQNDKSNALGFYIKAGNYQKAIPLLEEAAEHHAGAADFYELEPYFMSVPEDIVLQSPILCSGISCIHTLNYRIEEAKNWYARLLSMRRTIPQQDKHRRKLLEETIVYTSLVLPDTGEKQLIGIFKNTAKLVLSGGFKMQDATMTGNLPSLMRGSKDFSRWSNHACLMRLMMKSILESLFKKFAIGVADIGVAEAMYEKNRLNESLIELTKGIAEVEQKGTPEIMYAGYTLMAKLMIANGQTDGYKTIMENTERKIERWNAPYLIANCRATMVRFDMLSGREDTARQWLYEYAPDETGSFRVLDRYQYLTKAKVYIQNEMYPQAIALLELLHHFYLEFRRPLDLTEDFIMQAIAFDRIGDTDLSMNRLEEALVMAQKHSFVRVFADEGEPCYRLLIKYSKIRSEKVQEDFLKKASEAAKSFALMYPRYLAVKKTLKSGLTKTEFDVLKLLDRGMSNGEIAEFLDISLDTVKFHTKNIYSKFNVKSRAQAVKLAAEQKIL